VSRCVGGQKQLFVVVASATSTPFMVFRGKIAKDGKKKKKKKKKSSTKVCHGNIVQHRGKEERQNEEWWCR